MEVEEMIELMLLELIVFIIALGWLTLVARDDDNRQ
jgi:hypothetical protein